MFEVGDAVIHPSNGAGIVTKIQSFGNQEDAPKYYKIEIVDDKSKTFVMVPVQQAESLNIRYAISEKHLDSVWHKLREVPHVLPDNHKQRYGDLEKKLDTQDILQYAEIVRDLEWRRMQEDHLNVPGRRIYDKALRLLVGELALSQGIQMREAETQVRTVLSENLVTRQAEFVATP